MTVIDKRNASFGPFLFHRKGWDADLEEKLFATVKARKRSCKAMEALARGKSALDEKYATELNKLIQQFGFQKDAPTMTEGYSSILNNLKETADLHMDMSQNLFDYVSAPMYNVNKYMKKQLNNVVLFSRKPCN